MDIEQLKFISPILALSLSVPPKHYFLFYLKVTTNKNSDKLCNIPFVRPLFIRGGNKEQEDH